MLEAAVSASQERRGESQHAASHERRPDNPRELHSPLQELLWPDRGKAAAQANEMLWSPLLLAGPPCRACQSANFLHRPPAFAAQTHWLHVSNQQTADFATGHTGSWAEGGPGHTRACPSKQPLPCNILCDMDRESHTLTASRGALPAAAAATAGLQHLHGHS